MICQIFRKNPASLYQKALFFNGIPGISNENELSSNQTAFDLQISINSQEKKPQNL